MSVSDRLDEIEDDIHAAFRLPKDAPVAMVAEEWAPDMLAALRAVLDLHVQGVAYGVPVCMTCAQVKDADEWDDPDDDPIPSWTLYPCPTVRAISAALGEGA